MQSLLFYYSNLWIFCFLTLMYMLSCSDARAVLYKQRLFGYFAKPGSLRIEHSRIFRQNPDTLPVRSINHLVSVSIVILSVCNISCMFQVCFDNLPAKRPWNDTGSNSFLLLLLLEYMTRWKCMLLNKVLSLVRKCSDQNICVKMMSRLNYYTVKLLAYVMLVKRIQTGELTWFCLSR